MMKTECLHLRNLRREDIPVIHKYRNDPDCARWQRWEDTSEEAVAAFVRNYSDSEFLSRQEEQHYVICAGETLVGDLSYFYTEEDRCITLGITISPEHQRRGYAKEVLSGVIAAVREKYPALDIVALIDPENAPSIALFESLGFERECYAERLQSYVYTLFSER